MKTKRKKSLVEFYIQDWAGNDKFIDKVFKTAEAANSFLINKFQKDEDLEEFYVMEREAD